jgi:hypothetical protein
MLRTRVWMGTLLAALTLGLLLIDDHSEIGVPFYFSSSR